jgi:hypothetical protein
LLKKKTFWLLEFFRRSHRGNHFESLEVEFFRFPSSKRLRVVFPLRSADDERDKEVVQDEGKTFE